MAGSLFSTITKLWSGLSAGINGGVTDFLNNTIHYSILYFVWTELLHIKSKSGRDDLEITPSTLSKRSWERFWSLVFSWHDIVF